jgi:hypothetical protein
MPIRLLATLALLIAGVIVSVVSFRDELTAASIARDGITAASARDLIEDGRPAALLFAAADRMDAGDHSGRELGMQLLKAGLEQSPHNADALARLSYLQSLDAGRFSRDAAESLNLSIKQCGYCSKDLLRWRLQYVLLYWQDVPEQIRRSVFQGADFLRWWHSDHEFLADARRYAQSELIPFNQYQRAVGSQVRPHELPDD